MPSRFQPGKKKGENNRKCGNRCLAWACVEAAHFACCHDEPCRRFYDRKKQQTNPAIATKVLACNLTSQVTGLSEHLHDLHLEGLFHGTSWHGFELPVFIDLDAAVNIE